MTSFNFSWLVGCMPAHEVARRFCFHSRKSINATIKHFNLQSIVWQSEREHLGRKRQDAWLAYLICLVDRRKPLTGCSKCSSFSPAQPWRAETRLDPSKAAVSYHLFLRGGWDDPNCARPTRAPSDPYSKFFLRGAVRLSFTARIEGAHSDRAASASKKDGLAVPLPPFRGRALREHGDRPSYPDPFSASCYGRIDCRNDIIHSWNQDSQSCSTGSGAGLFTGCCGVGFTAGGVAGAA